MVPVGSVARDNNAQVIKEFDCRTRQMNIKESKVKMNEI